MHSLIFLHVYCLFSFFLDNRNYLFCHLHTYSYLVMRNYVKTIFFVVHITTPHRINRLRRRKLELSLHCFLAKKITKIFVRHLYIYNSVSHIYAALVFILASNREFFLFLFFFITSSIEKRKIIRIN